jgi:GxxExxY protein
MIHEETTSKIIGAFYTVYNTLGHGFLEKVYENALAIELRRQGMIASSRKGSRCSTRGSELVSTMLMSLWMAAWF